MGKKSTEDNEQESEKLSKATKITKTVVKKSTEDNEEESESVPYKTTKVTKTVVKKSS